MSADSAPLTSSLLLLRGRDGSPAGVAFLVTEELAVTCAHVVRAVLGLAPTAAPPPDAAVSLEPALPRSGDGGRSRLLATVAHWVPEGDQAGDIAVLRLGAPVPGSEPVWMVAAGDAVWGHPVRTFGFPAGRSEGVWHAGILRSRQASGWLQFEQAPGSAYEISRGFSGSPVWDEQLGAVVGMVVAADTGRPAGFLIPVAHLVEAYPPLDQVLNSSSPFPGLAPFQERDAAMFFGRDAESGAIVDLVRANPVVTIFGASGSGKSSVVRAGVVPRLRTAGYDVAVLRPASAAALLPVLAAELTQLSQPDLDGEAFRTAVRETRLSLATHGLTEHAVEGMGRRDRRGLVIVVDQLEELLGGEDAVVGQPPAGEEEPATSAVARLLFPEQAIPGLRVVTTLRADFLEPISEHPALRGALDRSTYLLRPMKRDQLREVVLKPVGATPGAAYDPGLAEQILEDLGDSPGVLPLLAFTLNRLWERRQGGRLSYPAYRELGGVRGALAAHAELARQRCHTVGLEPVMWRLLLKLVQLPAGGRVPMRHPVPRADLTPAEWEAATVLAGARLLTLGADRAQPETVELAHEVLISAWPALKQQVDADRDFLAWRAQLRQDRDRWEQAGQPVDLLPASTTLEQARYWEQRQRTADLSPTDHEFIRRGRQRVRRQQRRRFTMLVAFGLVLAVASAFGALFVNQSRVSQARAAESTSRSLAVASTDLRHANPPTAIMLALGAYQVAPTELARDTMLQTYLDLQGVEWIIADPRSPSRSLAASRDGRVIVGTTVVGRATLFLRDARGRGRQEPLPWDGSLGYALDQFVTPDGRRVGYISADGTLVWFAVNESGTSLVGEAHHIPGRELEVLEGYPRQLIAASGDGARVAVITNQELVAWDLDQSAVLAAWTNPAGFGEVTNLWYGPDQDTVIVEHTPAGADQRLTAVDLITGEPSGMVEGFRYAGLSGDGRTAVVCGASDEYGLLDTATGTLQTMEFDTGQSCGPIAMDHTGRHAAIGFGAPTVFQLDDGTLTELPERPENLITDAGDSTVHRQLVADGDELFLLVHTSHAAALIHQPGSDEKVIELGSLALTPDGATIVGFSADGSQLHVGSVESEMDDAISVWRRDATKVPHYTEITIDESGSYLADQVTDDRIEIRELATLEVISTVRPEPLPEDAPVTSEVHYWFPDDESLLTQTHTVVEMWDLRSGSRRARVDLADLGIRHGWGRPSERSPRVHPYPEAGHIAVTDGGTAIRVVDLRARREVESLRLETGEEILTVRFDPIGTHLVVIRPGGAFWEVWRLDPPRRVLGPMPSACGDCTETDVVAVTYLGAGRVLLANGSTIRVHAPGQSQPVEQYSLGEAGSFHDVSRDGNTVIYSPEDADFITIFRLDQPGQWQERLCEVLGWREITDAERTLIPSGLLADPVCDQAAT